ncbi:hypothetical protein [Neisseria wadsworthii]|uniref:Uncharacterized protein n=1 Tax=Neisseria wadsworthii 9715 TaxID=1030841 RepID=G4CRZ0_9NEIS|nr:hypothetical protein [Neisseria wadsworthii]EGZ44904.1 hypothetical protein HMPREF9370_1850 [Neisseria wadsworthii 9715]QMT35509.1 hypothetical protein H3L96_10835 [Neisseria wadsworthii]
MMRDTLCKTYPNAIIHVRDKNGNEARNIALMFAVKFHAAKYQKPIFKIS